MEAAHVYSKWSADGEFLQQKRLSSRSRIAKDL